MKRIFVLLLALIMALSLSACGEPEKDYSNLYGTWKVSYIESDGSEFSVEEWKEQEGDDYSKNTIVIKSNGKAGVVEEDYTWNREWYVVGNILMLDYEEYEIVGDMLRFDDWGDYICYEKVSNNQTVPKNDSDDDAGDDTSSMFEEEPSNNTSDSADWREFLKEYEEWADKYIAVVKKQKANPSDMSILTEYTQLITELAEWSEKADEVSDSITDVKEAAEYSAEVMRIAAKIAKAAEGL